MIMKTPYDIPVAKTFDLKKIQSQIAEAVVAGEYATLDKVRESRDIYRRPDEMWGVDLASDTICIVRNTEYKTSVEPFPYPIKVRTAAGKELYALDLKFCVAEERNKNLYGKMYNPDPAKFLVELLPWMRAWDAGEYGDIRRVHDYVTGTFAVWVSSVISNVTGVHGGEDFDIIRFLACYWFQSQFSPVPYVMDEQERLRMRRIMVNCWPRPDSVVDLQTKDFQYIGSLEEFIEAVKRMLPKNRRMQMLNRAMFTQQVSNGWYGFNPGMMPAAALEYPPMFIAMYYFSLTNSSQQGHSFGKATQVLRDTQKRADFLASYRRTVNVWKQP